MKKFVVSLLALALTVPLAFAQTGDGSTGTYTGTVLGKCLITTDLAENASLTLTNEAGSDEFDDTFRNTGSYFYQSNTGCTVDYSSAQTSGPLNELTADEIRCNGDDKNVVATEAQTPASVNVDFVASDVSDGVLQAGTYGFSCTVDISPAS